MYTHSRYISKTYRLNELEGSSLDFKLIIIKWLVTCNLNEHPSHFKFEHSEEYLKLPNEDINLRYGNVGRVSIPISSSFF